MDSDSEAEGVASGESSFLLGSVASSSKRPFISFKTQKRLLLLLSFFVSVFGLFPTAVKMVVPSKHMRHDLLYGGCGLLFAVAVYMAATTLRKENRARAEVRANKREYEKVMDGTYRCVQPQILNSMVVAPVKVRRRDAAQDRVLAVDDESVTVELAQGSGRFDLAGADVDKDKRQALKNRGADTAERLRVLFSDLVNGRQQSREIDDREFSVKIFTGVAGGPTGLAFAVSNAHFGPRLASVVGQRLEGGSKGLVGAPPTSGRGKTD
jgi:hypothetical protein